MDRPAEESRPEAGTAGASARQEYERRRANRERRTRERHPRIGDLLLAMRDAPAHELSWQRGAGGEERIGRRLRELCGERVVLLHDRQVPGTRANIDHLVIAPTGVWVVDTKRYRGKVEIDNPLFGRPRLKIAGRDRSRLAEGLAWQAERVSAAVLQIDPAVPVRAALCFVDADLPLFRTLRFRGYPLVYPKRLAKKVNAGGDVSDRRIRAIAQLLAARFSVAARR